jgi:hypothetical protein
MNVDYCILASERAIIEIDPDARLVCPECAKPLKLTLRPVPQLAGNRLQMIGTVLCLALMGAGMYAGYWLATPAVTPLPSTRSIN